MSFAHNPYAKTPSSSSSSFSRDSRPATTPMEALDRLLVRQDVRVSVVSNHLERLLTTADGVPWTEAVVLTLTYYTMGKCSQHLLSSSARSKSDGMDAATDWQEATTLLDVYTRTLDQWSIDLMYAAMTTQPKTIGTSSSSTMLDLLKELTHLDPPVYASALRGLSTACHRLDKLQQYTSSLPVHQSDVAWYLSEEDAAYLAPLAVQCLTSFLAISDQNMAKEAPDTDRFRITALQILSVALKHCPQCLDKFSKSELHDFYRQMLAETQFLHESSQSNLTLERSLLAISVVSLLLWRYELNCDDYNRLLHSQNVVEKVVDYCVTKTSDPNNTAGDVILCWSLTKCQGWDTFVQMESRYRSFLNSFFQELLQGRASNLSGSTIWIAAALHQCHRAVCRESLTATARYLNLETRGNGDWKSVLVSLFTVLKEGSIAVRLTLSRFLHMLLSDRRVEYMHDTLSRELWTGMNSALFNQFIELAISLSKQNDASSRLVALNILDIIALVSDIATFGESGFKDLCADDVESLIFFVKPVQVRFDFLCDDDMGGVPATQDSETPPLNNLSRLDDRSICVEQEEEKPATGVELTLRLSAALALTHLVLGGSAIVDESKLVLKTRILETMNDFLQSCSPLIQERQAPMSSTLDYCTRLFRLQHAMTTPENEAFLVSMRYASQQQHDRNFRTVQQKNAATAEKLRVATVGLEKLQSAREKDLEQFRSQRTIMQREVARVRNIVVIETKHVTALYVQERNNAERLLSEKSAELMDTTKQWSKAKENISQAMRNEEEAKVRLAAAAEEVTKLKDEVQDVSRQLNIEEAKVQELTEDLESQGKETETLRLSIDGFEQEVSERDDQINDLERKSGGLRDELEDLFADMVSLAQIYEHKEQDMQKQQDLGREAIEKERHQTGLERTKYEKLSVEISDLKIENDKLYTKLAKYKDRLDAERQYRKKVEDQRKKEEPISYINQLHRSARENSHSHGDTSSSVEKENTSTLSSRGSQRRRHL